MAIQIALDLDLDLTGIGIDRLLHVTDLLSQFFTHFHMEETVIQLTNTGLCNYNTACRVIQELAYSLRRIGCDYIFVGVQPFNKLLWVYLDVIPNT